MFKKISSFTLFMSLCIVLLHAVERDKKIEVTAKSISTTKNTVYANEGVIVYYNNAVIKSERATYNKETKLLVLDGNVEMIGYEGSKEHTNHMELQTDTKEVFFKKLFLASENDVWLLSDSAHKKEGKYILGNSILSSCEVENPLWHLAFSHSIYDSNKKYMKLYHAKVYFGDIPVFYTPYLAFSTSKKRSSGLLIPKLNYTNAEGYLYEQPVFWAISPSVDLELNPQIRTSRSMGLYSTLRFANSDHSLGKIRLGYFKDNDSYVQTYKPRNQKHYGIEFNYESSKVFSSYLPEDYTDGLYINGIYLNDIDYINLQRSQFKHFGLMSQQESRVNYFADNDKYYFGLNAKYFIATEQENNDKTEQVLPSVQWHKYLDSLIWNNLTYSVDMHMNNITRKKGSTLKQAEIRAPFEYNMAFFDNFLNISLSEEFYYSKYFFGNGTYPHDKFQYYSNVHKAKIFTDLTKHYDSFSHVMLPSITYVKPGSTNESPIKFSALEKEQKGLSPIGEDEEKINFSLSQYIYDENVKLEFFQKFSQDYFPNRKYKLDDMRNEMGYYWKKLAFYNQIIYSNKFNAIHTITSDIALNETDYKFRIGHIYQQNLTDEITNVAVNNLDLSFGYAYNDYVSFGGGIIYDIEKSTKKQWQASFGYHRDCWRIDMSIRQDIQPASLGLNRNPVNYGIQLNFIPFGAIGTDTTK